MPGLCGAIRLHGPAGGDRLEHFVSLMLSALHREPFYLSKKWTCPGGEASFASTGLESLQKPLDLESAPLQGLRYGNASFPATFDRGWLGRVRGFFSLALRDESDGSYVVSTDRRASEPVYYAEVSGILCFAPEVGALLSLPGVSREADYGALSSLVVSGHLLRDMTLFRGVRRLEGGQALKVSNGRWRRETHWEFAPGASAQTDEEDLLARLDVALGRAVQTELADNGVKSAVFLSGGCDSRVILGYARQLRDVHTVSWGLREDQPGSDGEIAGRLARACGTEHLFLQREVDGFGEMFEEASAVTESQSDVAAFHPQEFRLMRRLRDAGFRRVIRGDETFGWKRMCCSALGARVTVGLRHFGSVEGLPQFFRPSAARKLDGESAFFANNLAGRIAPGSANQLKDVLYFNQRLQHYLNSCASFKQCLLEHSNPLLADDILEFLSRVPEALRVDKKLLRMLLARRFPDLHAAGYARSDGLEDWSRLWREESPVRSYMGRQLADARSAVWEVYDRNALQRVFDARTEEIGYRPRGLAERALVRTARDLLKPVSRGASDHLQARLALRAPVGTTKILMRFLVVKNWVDRFGPVLG